MHCRTEIYQLRAAKRRHSVLFYPVNKKVLLCDWTLFKNHVYLEKGQFLAVGNDGFFHSGKKGLPVGASAPFRMGAGEESGIDEVVYLLLCKTFQSISCLFQ